MSKVIIEKTILEEVFLCDLCGETIKSGDTEIKDNIYTELIDRSKKFFYMNLWCCKGNRMDEQFHFRRHCLDDLILKNIISRKGKQ